MHLYLATLAVKSNHTCIAADRLVRTEVFESPGQARDYIGKLADEYGPDEDDVCSIYEIRFKVGSKKIDKIIHHPYKAIGGKFVGVPLPHHDVGYVHILRTNDNTGRTRTKGLDVGTYKFKLSDLPPHPTWWAIHGYLLHGKPMEMPTVPAVPAVSMVKDLTNAKRVRARAIKAQNAGQRRRKAA